MKKQLTKFLSVVLAVAIVSSCSFAFAANDISDRGKSPEIRVQWTNTDFLASGLNISSWGKATCFYDVELTNSTDTATVKMYLQRLKGDTWRNVTSWTATGSGNFGDSKQYYVTSGYNYRVHTALYVYDSAGNFAEYVAKDSPTKYY